MKRATRPEPKTAIQAKKLSVSPQQGKIRAEASKLFLPRGVVLALGLLVMAGATWAVFELIIWNKLPPELVGKWVVEGGPQDGATFDFFRNGTLEAHLNNQGQDFVLKARVAVEGKTLLTTTRNPNTLKDETRRSTIRELTRTALVVEFKKGEVWTMVRASD